MRLQKAIKCKKHIIYKVMICVNKTLQPKMDKNDTFQVSGQNFDECSFKLQVYINALARSNMLLFLQ